jgi:hypothetical protein
VDEHRAKLRIKKFEMYKRKTLDKRVDFNLKNTFIERQIEQNLAITKKTNFKNKNIKKLRQTIQVELIKQRSSNIPMEHLI